MEGGQDNQVHQREAEKLGRWREEREEVFPGKHEEHQRVSARPGAAIVKKVIRVGPVNSTSTRVG